MEHFCFESHMGENWFTYPALYKAVVDYFPSGSHFIEVGVWKGMSASFMAVEIINSQKQIKFDCIDTWLGSEEHKDIAEVQNNTLYEKFLENIKPVAHIINPIRIDSVEASKNYADGSINFVFIDGDHSYEGCKRDILAWLPKIADGGILAGHDYAWTPHIQQLVSEIFGEGDFSDPWNTGCFIVYIKDGKPLKLQTQKSEQTFFYEVKV